MKFFSNGRQRVKVALAVSAVFLFPGVSAQEFAIDSLTSSAWNPESHYFSGLRSTYRETEVLDGIEPPPADTLRIFSNGESELAYRNGSSSSSGTTNSNPGTNVSPFPASRLVEYRVDAYTSAQAISLETEPHTIVQRDQLSFRTLSGRTAFEDVPHFLELLATPYSAVDRFYYEPISGNPEPAGPYYPDISIDPLFGAVNIGLSSLVSIEYEDTLVAGQGDGLGTSYYWANNSGLRSRQHVGATSNALLGLSDSDASAVTDNATYFELREPRNFEVELSLSHQGEAGVAFQIVDLDTMAVVLGVALDEESPDNNTWSIDLTGQLEPGSYAVQSFAATDAGVTHEGEIDFEGFARIDSYLRLWAITGGQGDLLATSIDDMDTYGLRITSGHDPFVGPRINLVPEPSAAAWGVLLGLVASRRRCAVERRR